MNFHDMGAPLRRKNHPPETDGLVVQRKCACGTHTGEPECEDCMKKDTIQHKDRGTSVLPSAGVDLTGVATHGLTIQRQPLDGALAMADMAPPAPEAAPEAAMPAAGQPTPAPTLIVEDETTELEAGQSRKTDFLQQLETAVCAEAEAALAGTEHATAGCPYLTFWFGYYRGQSSDHIENAIRRYTPEASGATTAAQYIPVIVARVRQGIDRWAATGEVTGVPEDAPGMAAAADTVQRKEDPDGGGQATRPAAVQARLGPGHPLDGGVRTRMEHAFGRSFTDVRAHTDPTASRISDEQHARAFTVGRDVAFGAGQYRPGTPVGDALIAHELAHVVQQRNADTAVSQHSSTENHGYRALEEDADRAAMAAVVSSWGGETGILTRQRGSLAGSLRSGLRSGLRLSRCSKSPEEKAKSALTYLQVLRTTGKIEGGADSKENARTVVDLWKQGQSEFILPPALKVLVVNELLNVAPTDAGVAIPAQDQAAIATLLEGMTDREIERVMSSVGDKVITGALQGDNLRRLEDRKKKVTSATPQEAAQTFDADRIVQLRHEFVENAKKDKGKGRLECIQILSTQLEKLYEGPAEKTAVKQGTQSYTKERKYEGRTLAESTLPNLMSRVEESKLVADKFMTDFTRDGTTRKPQAAKESPWAAVTKMVGSTHGWHFFTMALMDGYHSVSLFVENRPDGMFLYWADQLYTSLTNLVEPGSVAGFRRYTGTSFDAYVLEVTKQFWDGYYEKCKTRKGITGPAFAPSCDSDTRLTIWKLRRNLPAAPPKPKPAPAPTTTPNRKKPTR